MRILGKIGSFGKTIIFETSDKKILKPDSLKREVKGRWTNYDRQKKKPLRHFNGPDLDEQTFTIVLDARHGVKPRKMLEKIENCVRKGTPENLVIGKKKIGKNKMVIESASETWDEIWNKGELVRVSVDITVTEYPK